MAIETQPEKAQGPGGGEPAPAARQGPRGPGGGEPAAAPRQRPWWMRPAVHTGLIGAVIGYLIGHLLGNWLAAANINTESQNLALSDSSDLPIVLGYLLAVVGWLAGLGIFNALLRQMAGRPVPAEEENAAAAAGLARYFRYSLDHKVVGIQYLVGIDRKST